MHCLAPCSHLHYFTAAFFPYFQRTTIKRLRIKSLPQVLVIQLKRFWYDWEAGRAIKFDDSFQVRSSFYYFSSTLYSFLLSLIFCFCLWLFYVQEYEIWYFCRSENLVPRMMTEVNILIPCSFSFCLPKKTCFPELHILNSLMLSIKVESFSFVLASMMLT